MRVLVMLSLGIAIVVAAALLMFAGNPDPRPGTTREPAAPAAAPSTATATDRGDARTRVAADLPAAQGDSQVLLLRYPADRERTTLRGEVRDEFEQPVGGASVALRPSFGSMHPLLAIADDRGAEATATTTADQAGAFAFARIPVGPYRLDAVAADGRRMAAEILVTTDDVEPLILRVAPVGTSDLVVEVLDGDGRPVAGAQVGVQRIPANEGTVDARRPADLTAASDEHGRCSFATAGEGSLVITASAGDTAAIGLRQAVALGARNEPVELRLLPRGDVHGRLRGVAAEQLDGAEIALLRFATPALAQYRASGCSWRAAVHAGEFAFAAVPAGQYALHLFSPRGLRLALQPLPGQTSGVASVRPLVVDVAPGHATEVDAEVTAGATIRGTVRTADGAPVANAIVSDTLAPNDAAFPDDFELFGAVLWRIDRAESIAHGHPAAHARTRTDANGRYEMLGLPPGRHRVEVFAAGLSLDQRTGLRLDADAPLQLEHVLEPAGVLQGRCAGGAYLGVRRLGQEQAEMVAAIGDDGAFTFPGLPAGEHELGKWYHETGAWLTLARATVVAGRTTRIELDDQGPTRIAGALRDGRGNPVQASVTLWSIRRATAPDGSFEFHLSWPLKNVFGAQLLRVQRGGLCWELPFPDDAMGVADWHGEFLLGDAELAIELVDADGRPLSGKILVGGPRLRDAAVATDAQGRATLSQLFAGEYSLGAQVADHIVTPIAVQVPAPQRVQLRAERSAVLDVQLLRRSGALYGRGPIEYSRWDHPGPASIDRARYARWSTATADVNGRARVVVPTGTLLVTTYLWDTEVRAQQLVEADTTRAVTLRLP